MKNKADQQDEMYSQLTEDPLQKEKKKSVIRELGLGLITGAADDDPSAIGTYASAGAKFGPSFLWMVPVMYPHDVFGRLSFFQTGPGCRQGIV